PPVVDALARTYGAADTPGAPPAGPPAAAAVVATPASDQAAPPAARAALSSDAFATTQDRASDLVIPGLEPSWFSRLRLPPSMSVSNLLGLATLALLSACVPIALLGLGVSLLSGNAATAAPVAKHEPRVESTVPRRPGPAITRQAAKGKAQSQDAN